MTKEALQLSRADVDAVEHYIWQHVRSAPNGKAYKVWKRMFEFIDKHRDAPVEISTRRLSEIQVKLF